MEKFFLKIDKYCADKPYEKDGIVFFKKDENILLSVLQIITVGPLFLLTNDKKIKITGEDTEEYSPDDFVEILVYKNRSIIVKKSDLEDHQFYYRFVSFPNQPIP